MKIIIGGCRYYNDYDTFCRFAEECFREIEQESVTIISGHCAGVDLMGERYAKEKGLAIEIFPANWKKYGRAAGPIRNKQMLTVSDCVIAFWDYKSKGTKSLILQAQQLGKKNEIAKKSNKKEIIIG